MINPIFANDQIKMFLPQRYPILMVDKLFEADSTHALTGLTISADNMFVQDGLFSESGLIEHAAQSASVLVGYEAYKNQQQAPVGYIGEVKKCHIFRRPKVGDNLVTSIEIVSEVDGLSLVKSQILVGDTPVFDCQMKIFVKKS